MAKAIDATGIQFRMLNLSKGPAMHSPRAQADRTAYTDYMKRALESETNLDLLQDTVTGVEVRNGKFFGVRLQSGQIMRAGAAILTCGTFLNGLIHIGMNHYPGGRTIAEPPVTGLTESLVAAGFTTARLKTGTPPRVDRRSIDYSIVKEQQGDSNPPPFSFSTGSLAEKQQISCFLTKTTSQTHEILKKGFDRSPLFTGKVQGVGPRYCPSIEDKIHRFTERDGHHIFLEPEGFYTNEMYVNGFSTSLPEDIQIAGMQSIPGMEEVKMIRPGYAIEYDYFHPSQIRGSLETKGVENLYFAGQINGTSGYEEAAAQGLMAGINASRKLKGLAPLLLRRSDAYIGVLIDDLVTKETNEPYRMFTSSAEHRLILRHDNADLRLRHIGRTAGLIDEETFMNTALKAVAVTQLTALARTWTISAAQMSRFQPATGEAPSAVPGMKVAQAIKRPEITMKLLIDALPVLAEQVAAITTDPLVHEQAEINLMYEGYIKRELLQSEKAARLDELKIPSSYNYHSITALSSEGREKLLFFRPDTLGQASRILGVSPSDISVLMVHLGR